MDGNSLRSRVDAALSATVMGLNTLVCALLVYALTVVRLLTPVERWRNAVRRALAAVAELWIAVNSSVIGRFWRTAWDVQLPAGLEPSASYVVNCNHQSWVDILVLQRVFNRRIPFMRFFIKQELIWVPLLGIAWWALDFPFMKRYSKQQLVADPSRRGRDLERARRACEKLRAIPVTMMNFMEGTRFTPKKHAAQKSPYRHLLKPRVGGLGQVFFSLDEQLRSLVDVTIVYPDGRPTFWQLIGGRVPRIVVHAREIAIPEHLRGVNFRRDSERRDELEGWTAKLWQEKDRLIGAVLAEAATADRGQGRAAA